MAEAGPSFGAVAAAFLRRDLALAASYRLGFVMRVGAVLITLWAFAAMARFVAPAGSPAEVPGGFLGFWAVGLITAELFHIAVSALSTRVRQAQVEGTLEAMLSTPAPAAYVVFGAVLYDLGAALVRVAVYVAAAGTLAGVDFSRAAPGAALLALAVALVAFVSLGLFGGALTMAFRRTDPVSALAWLGAVAVGGVFYPVEALPAWMQPLSVALPITPALEALRAALFQGELARDSLLHLGAFAAVVGPLAAWMLGRTLARARADGSLGQY